MASMPLARLERGKPRLQPAKPRARLLELGALQGHDSLERLHCAQRLRRGGGSGEVMMFCACRRFALPCTITTAEAASPVATRVAATAAAAAIAAVATAAILANAARAANWRHTGRRCIPRAAAAADGCRLLSVVVVGHNAERHAVCLRPRSVAENKPCGAVCLHTSPLLQPSLHPVGRRAAMQSTATHAHAEKKSRRSQIGRALALIQIS